MRLVEEWPFVYARHDWFSLKTDFDSDFASILMVGLSIAATLRGLCLHRAESC